MKLTSALLTLLPALALAESDLYTPVRISLEDLSSGQVNDQLLDTLEHVGMVSITNIPGFHCKQTAMEHLTACMDESSDMSMDLDLADGTHRRTFASHSKGCQGKVPPMEVAAHGACDKFQESSQPFREIVANVVEIFGTVLGKSLDLTKPVLMNAQDEGYSFGDVFVMGDQLEHFHTYDKTVNTKDQDSIEWHLDQGLALAFTPGMIQGETAHGFYIRLANGESVMVDFDSSDDLVFLLGDGVNQYVNPALSEGMESLRAVPHSFRMPETESSRLWYGRMMLPPPDAKHPVHDLTFGEIRQGMLQEDTASSEFGCSRDMVARELEDVTCEGESFYCWHRCMNYTDYNVSPSTCEAEGLDLACVNSVGQLWDNSHNSSFTIGCVDLDTAVPYVPVTADDGEENVTAVPSSAPTAADDDGQATTSVFLSSVFVVLSVVAVFME